MIERQRRNNDLDLSAAVPCQNNNADGHVAPGVGVFRLEAGQSWKRFDGPDDRDMVVCEKCLCEKCLREMGNDYDVFAVIRW